MPLRCAASNRRKWLHPVFISALRVMPRRRSCLLSVLSLIAPGVMNVASSRIAIICLTLRPGCSCFKAIALVSMSSGISLAPSLSARTDGISASQLPSRYAFKYRSSVRRLIFLCAPAGVSYTWLTISRIIAISSPDSNLRLTSGAIKPYRKLASCCLACSSMLFLLSFVVYESIP
ncbi:hypothetical protein D3C77_544460 [compost metagenome]